ncbi:MAG: glycosyltransferase [Blastocatellia bacterium]|nr:glycosyltransferase [Blastocatellia bacterium]
MKTLHFTNAYHATSGGIRTFYQEMLAAANRQRRWMRLVVPSDRTAVEEVGEYGRIYHLTAPRSWLFDVRYRLLLPHTYLFSARSQIRQILLNEKPDLIEVCDKYSLCWLAGLIRKGWWRDVPRPALIGLSCERMDDNLAAWVAGPSLSQKFAQLYLRHLYLPLFDYHIANSQYTASELQQATTKRHERIVRVCPMGVNMDVFSPARRNRETRRKLLTLIAGNERTRLLLYAGRLSAEKNLPLLLDTMRCLRREEGRDFRLLIAGDGPLANWLRQENLRQPNPPMHLLGQLQSREALADLYANCDAFVHPNPHEPFGIAPLEAMASGLPLVAPKAGGVLTYANTENAWLAAPNGEAFADAVREVFADEEVRWHRVNRARRTAAAYSWDNITTEFFKLYDQLYHLAQEETSTGRFSHTKQRKGKLALAEK